MTAKPTVFLVDDDRAVLKGLSRLLRSGGEASLPAGMVGATTKSR